MLQVDGLIFLCGKVIDHEYVQMSVVGQAAQPGFPESFWSDVLMSGVS